MKLLINSIFVTLKNWFTPPVFEDQSKTLKARNSFALAMVGFTTSVLIFIFFMLFAPENNFRLAVIGASILLSLLPIVLLRKGYVQAAIFLQAGIIWVGVVTSSISTGGVRSIGFIGGTIAALLVMGIALERVSTFIFIFISILSAGVLAWAEAHGYIDTTTIDKPVVLVATYASFLFVLTGLLYVTYQSVTQALAKANQELIERQRAEARLRGVFENSPDIILEIDRAGQIIFINHYAETQLGKNVRDVLPADQREYALEMIERAFNSGESEAFELQTIAPDNHVSWDSIRIGAVKHEGQITSLTIIMTEITAQKDAEAVLRAREELYRLISTITADYVFSTQLETDGRLHLKWVGGAFESITGYTFEEYVARGGWLATLYLEDREVDARDMASLRANQNVISEIRTLHKSGAVRWVRVYAHPLWDSEHNRLSGIYGAVQDITERKQAEEERENLFKEIEAKNAELERFNYTISHELKSPVVTIKGFVGMLKKDLKEDNQNHIEKDLNRISEAADKMGTLLSELLELSRIGRIANPPEKVDLGKLIQLALETLDGRLNTCNITVTVLPDLPIVYADRIRLREVLENLIDNAVKYMGDQAYPLIEIGKRESGTETIIYVKDNGIGIESQFHAKIFGLFEKLSANSEGTGIGLALIKRIIEVQGGKIWVESEGAGKGSTFCFTISVVGNKNLIDPAKVSG